MFLLKTSIQLHFAFLALVCFKIFNLQNRLFRVHLFVYLVALLVGLNFSFGCFRYALLNLTTSVNGPVHAVKLLGHFVPQPSGGSAF